MLIPETIAPQRVTMSASGPNSAPPEWYCHFRTQVRSFCRRPQAQTEHGGDKQHGNEDAKRQVVAPGVVEEQAEERRTAGGEDAGHVALTIRWY